jgi:hypothetical protein
MALLDMNCCVVKYIHLKDLDLTVLHTTQDYEYSSATVHHNSYEEMENAVRENCPSGFVCFDPITLHHEVLWKTSLRANEHGLIEVDQLFQPIDDMDYAAMRWGVGGDSKPSVCVQIERSMVLLG